jgi:hypothetical protein
MMGCFSEEKGSRYVMNENLKKALRVLQNRGL